MSQKMEKKETKAVPMGSCKVDSCKISKYAFCGCFGLLGLMLLIPGVVPVPVVIQMIMYTSSTLYIGSHLSLKQSEIDVNTGEKMRTESMNRTDALLFPVIGSCALCSLYVAYKFLDAAWVNFLLTLYLTFIGLMAIAETFLAVITPVCSKSLSEPVITFNIPFMKPKPVAEEGKTEETSQKDDSLVKINPLQIFCYLVALTVCGLWLFTKHWVLHNILALAFCIQAIALVSVGNFTIAAILLSGLFFYDIFWVFGTDVMVTVAKSFEGPAKLIFPVRLDPWQQSILGLGDIVIPGVLMSMCLRFDHWMHEDKTNGGQSASAAVDIHKKFSKFYFWVVLIFYELGLITTCIIMIAFQHPQPALLYLVPFCLFGLFGSAALNGQVKQLLAYSESEEENTEKKTS